MDQLDLQSALHILVNADMRLTAAVIERPGTQLIDIAVIMLQDTLHGFGVTGAGRVDHKIRQRALAAHSSQMEMLWVKMSFINAMFDPPKIKK